MRQQYETEKDRQNEQVVAEAIESAWKLRTVKMPKSYHLDYALTNEDNSLRGFVEIKCRRTKRYNYPTYLISLSKVLAAKRLTESTNLCSFLVVKWLDDIAWVYFNDPHTLGFGGRTDRNDSADQEPVAFYRISDFKQLSV